MIDLRAHLVPGFVDGPEDLDMAIGMARMAVADGILVAACSPPFCSGLSTPSPFEIRQAVSEFGKHLLDNHVPLHVVPSSQVHFRTDLVEALASGQLQSINGSRYVLVDLPPMVPPAKLEPVLRNMLSAGRVPVLASPERLKWIEAGFDFIVEMVDAGVWLQVTAGSLAGTFGPRTRYWAERLLGNSMVHILASDAHDTGRRSPRLSEGFELARKIVGEDEAMNLVLARPLNILDNEPVEASPRVAVTVEESWNPVADLRDLLKRAV
jgi:protein-tyrosine phosphatase